MRFHRARLGVYVAVVAAVYLWARGQDPRPWAPVVLAAVPAVVLSPTLLLSLEGLLGRGQVLAEDEPRASRWPTRPRGWQGGREAYGRTVLQPARDQAGATRGRGAVLESRQGGRMPTLVSVVMSEQLSRAVAGEIRRLLEERGISGNALAKATGISQPSISNKLNGRHAFDLDDLQVICAFLDVSVADLLSWAERA